MSADQPNVAVLAAAGSRKTQQVIDRALAAEGRVALVTFTNENRDQIIRRIENVCGTVPPHIHVMGWLAFLITHGAKPFQRSLTNVPFGLRGLNFHGEPARFTSKRDISRYYIDGRGDLYGRNLADFVNNVDRESGGAVMDRLGRIYESILVDEVQDLVGWDLDVLDRLIDAAPKLLMVGDPRQHTFGTSRSSRNKKYRGAGLSTWLEERTDRCAKEVWTESYRCHQRICDFADGIFPDLPATTSVGVADTGHDGIFTIRRDEVHDYVAQYNPVVLRRKRDQDTLGLAGVNIGVAKGSTFDRVLIFPTASMKAYLDQGDLEALKEPEKLYVAVTRARYSAAFVA